MTSQLRYDSSNRFISRRLISGVSFMPISSIVFKKRKGGGRLSHPPVQGRPKKPSLLKRIIHSKHKYAEVLEKAGLQILFKRRQEITERFFNEVVNNQRHRLHSLLPQTNASRYTLRRSHMQN